MESLPFRHHSLLWENVQEIRFTVIRFTQFEVHEFHLNLKVGKRDLDLE